MGVVAEVDIIMRVVAVDVASAVVVVKVDLLNNKGRFLSLLLHTHSLPTFSKIVVLLVALGV